MIHLDLSEDQQQMLDGAVTLLGEHSPVSRLRAGRKAEDVHALLAAWGWFRIGLPEDQGGLSLGIAEEVLLYCEAGRFLLSPSVLATTLAATLADADTRAAFLDGRMRAALAIPGQDGIYCFDRGDASHLVIAGLDRILLVSADVFAGESVEGLDEAVVTEKGGLDSAVSGRGGTVDRATLLVAAMLAGIAGASCDLAVDYAKLREQFGQPIGAFQAIKHICADMGLAAYAAEAQVKTAAVMAAGDPAGALFDIRAAAVTAMVAARANASAAIQVHGGIGFTADCEVHFHLKRAHLLGQLLGGVDHQQRALMALPFPQGGMRADEIWPMRWDWVSPDLPGRDACVLRHILEARAARQPDKLFVRFDNGQAWTYGETLDHARRAAAGLAGLGVGMGDVLFVLLPNGPDFLKAWFGANFLGAAVAAPNTAMRGATLQHLVTLSDARVAVVDVAYLNRFDGLDMGRIDTMILSGAVQSDDPLSVGNIFDRADPAAARAVVVEPWQAQFILFTSGTTGPSKGAIVTYVQMHDMVLATAAGRLDQNDVYLASTPLFHVGGSRVVHGMLMLGGSVVLLAGFKTESFWETVRHYGATAAVLIGAAARFLEDQPPRPDDADNPLRFVSMVPMVSDPGAFSRRFGLDIATSYGMSELSIPILSEVNPSDPDSCGRLRPGYEARIVDEHDREVGEGEVGELILRADRPWTISPGYWRMPEATAEVWRNGWFHTGDRLRRNADGDYYFVDRRKDAIRRRGENVSAFEVEAELLKHPAVGDAAVIGVPATVGEDDIMAVLVLRPGATLEPDALLDYLRPLMAYHMVPRYIRYVADLPRTPSMRVQKHLLRAEGVTADSWDREAAGIVIRRDS